MYGVFTDIRIVFDTLSLWVTTSGIPISRGELQNILFRDFQDWINQLS